LGGLADRREVACIFRFGFIKQAWVMEDHREMLEQLLSLRAARFVRSVSLDYVHANEMTDCLSRLQQVRSIRIASPQDLSNAGFIRAFESGSWPRLEELYLLSCPIDREACAALARIPFPRLRRLALIHSIVEYESGVLDDICRAERAPALEELRTNGLDQEEAERLARLGRVRIIVS
jgi:hypothetical protein